MSNVSQTNHVSEKESGEGTIQYPFTRLRVLLGCLLLMASAYLTVDCSLVFCGDQPGDVPAVSASTAQSATVTEQTKRPVTVADSIQMTRLGDPSYTDGAPSNGIVAKFSPDGKHFVVVLKKGNLEVNTNEYSLVLFQTAEVFQSPKPRVLYFTSLRPINKGSLGAASSFSSDPAIPVRNSYRPRIHWTIQASGINLVNTQRLEW